MAARQWITTNQDGTRTVVNYESSPIEDNYDAIMAAATNALSTNRAYVALASPSAAQNTAQVKALSRQINGLIRHLLGDFNGTD
jgi:hypothetical protein